MNTITTYAIGIATPFILWIGYSAVLGIADLLDARRYQKAWDKFGAEFDRLTPEELANYQRAWAVESYHFAHYCDDRSRYFAMKWRHGQTTEV